MSRRAGEGRRLASESEAITRGRRAGGGDSRITRHARETYSAESAHIPARMRSAAVVGRLCPSTHLAPSTEREPREANSTRSPPRRRATTGGHRPDRDVAAPSSIPPPTRDATLRVHERCAAPPLFSSLAGCERPARQSYRGQGRGRGSSWEDKKSKCLVTDPSEIAPPWRSFARSVSVGSVRA